MGQLTAARGPVYYLKSLPIEFTGLSAFHKRPLSGNSPSENAHCQRPTSIFQINDHFLGNTAILG